MTAPRSTTPTPTKTSQSSSCSKSSSLPSVEERWSDANVKDALKLWGYGPKEEVRMREIQKLIANKVGDYWKNDPYEVAGYLKDFSDWSPSKIADLFMDMVQWRLDNDMDTYCERYTPPPELAYFPAFLLNDLDREGDPVYIVRVGAWKAWDMYNDPRVGPDGILDYSQFLQELVGTREIAGVPKHWNWQTEYYQKVAGKRYTQFTNVFDMEGLSWSQQLKSPLFNVMGISSRRGQDYYAGTAKRIIILRAPRLFKMAWSMIKHFVDPQMQELLVFSSTSDYLQVWDKYMKRESMPACMNPNGRGQPMPGYWEHVQMQGGTIPPNLPNKDIKQMLPRMDTASLTDDEEESLTDDDEVAASSRVSVSTKTISLFKGHLDIDNNEVVIKKSVSFQPGL